MKYTIIAGAPNQDPDFLKKAIDPDSYIIAADSGYIYSKSAGFEPDLIIGDFDSSDMPVCDAEILRLPHEKDDTDTFYCIKEAVKRGADEVEIFCALGGRADHTLSNIFNLEYLLRNHVRASIISDKCVLTLQKKSFEIHKGKYAYFSLFALGGDVTGLSIKGAAYELSDFTLSTFSSIGQSNEFKNDTVKITFDSGCILLILSND